jgi:thiaminase
MAVKQLTSEQILNLLSESPSTLAALTASMTHEQLHISPAVGEWSVNEILAHLRACADVWGDCMATILAQDKPTIRAINPTTWIEQTDYREQLFYGSFQAFQSQRHDLLALLEAIAPESWFRRAIVTGAGKPLERTVHSYAQWLATHERSHVKHIKRLAIQFMES